MAQFTSFLAFTLTGWVSWPVYIFVFLASLSALWWPNIWPKMGFPDFFENTVASIQFISGIYPYGMSLLTPIHIRVPSLVFPFSALWWPNIWPKWGFRYFLTNYWPSTLHSWHLPLWGGSLDPYTFCVPSLIFGPLVAKYFVENGVSKTFWKHCSLKSFTPMGWVSWPLFIFVFLASFSALWWPNIWPKMGFP